MALNAVQGESGSPGGAACCNRRKRLHMQPRATLRRINSPADRELPAQ